MIRNTHQRKLTASVDFVGPILDTLAGPNDLVWPADAWPAMKLDRGLMVGSSGGHGPIRYHVEAVEPGRSVVFRFEPGMGIVGTHRFTVASCAEGQGEATGGTIVRHELEGSATGPMRIVWPLVIRWLHDATVEDALDNVEAAVMAKPMPTRNHSFWVKVLRSLVGPSPATTSPLVRALGDATSCALLGLGALHAAWGVGVTWPGSDSLSLARKVIGASTFPSSVDCFVVAALLATASGFVVARTHPTSRIGWVVPAPISGLGVSAVAVVLAARGALGWVGSAAKLLPTTAEFRRLNLLVYSPLCLLLAAGAFSVTGIRQKVPKQA
jgi:Protein of unknown function (DUF3995)